MFKHVVMWTLKDNAMGADKKENAEKIVRMAADLKGKIDLIRHIEVGIDVSCTESSYDIVLYSEFDSKEDCQSYAVHPEHQKVVSFIKEVVSDRKVVDYEI